jgi:NitT/TauT family transport system substrate-binding protein
LGYFGLKAFRGIVAGAAGLALAGTLSSAALAQNTPIKFSLDWKFEGPAAPFLVALEKGYFTEEGLDVTIDTGAGSLEPINRVASGTYQMGFGDINSLIKLKDQNPGAPVQAIYMVYTSQPLPLSAARARASPRPRTWKARRSGPQRLMAHTPNGPSSCGQTASTRPR